MMMILQIQLYQGLHLLRDITLALILLLLTHIVIIIIPTMLIMQLSILPVITRQPLFLLQLHQIISQIMLTTIINIIGSHVKPGLRKLLK